jgi:hypothetical protein
MAMNARTRLSVTLFVINSIESQYETLIILSNWVVTEYQIGWLHDIFIILNRIQI